MTDVPISAVGSPKDRQRIGTRCDRCPKPYLTAITLTATAICWLQNLTLNGTVQLSQEISFPGPLVQRGGVTPRAHEDRVGEDQDVIGEIPPR